MMKLVALSSRIGFSINICKLSKQGCMNFFKRAFWKTCSNAFHKMAIFCNNFSCVCTFHVTTGLSQKFYNIFVMRGIILFVTTRLNQKFYNILEMKDNSVALDAFAEVVKVTNHTGLWDAQLAWYSPSATL